MLLLAFAPSLLKLRTIPAPMPRAPPVTIATLPCNDIIVSIEWLLSIDALCCFCLCYLFILLMSRSGSVPLGVVAVGAISVPYSEGGLRAIQD